MSVKVMNAVFERYPNGGGEMILALALADCADDDGKKIFPAVSTLARKTRQAPRTVQYQLRRMQEMGWLELVKNEGGGRSRAREYAINSEWIKGVELAPLKDARKSAIVAASFEGGKGADIASIDEPETMQDLHPLQDKGCNLERKRVQSTTLKGAIAVAPEPSGTIKNHLHHHQHAESFQMSLDWKPSDQLPVRLIQAGLTSGQLTQEILGEFVSYRSTTDDQLTQAQWEHKLLQTLLARRKVHADESCRPSGQQRSGRDAVRRAIDDVSDTSWAAGL